MHVPDHLINNGTELVAGMTAAAVLGATVAGVPVSGRDRSERRPAPTLLEHPDRPAAQMATAALVFALQMVNFPVLPGTSGHLLGGALATALIGPRRALLAVSSVVIAQALVFADGGAGALGVNLWLIAILPVAVAAGTQSFLGARRGGSAPWWAVAGLAAVLGPPLASLAFSALYAAGASGDVTTGRVAASMLAVHAAIGVGEAAVTLAVLWAVQRIGADQRIPTPAPVWGAAVLAATGLSLAASSHPDGLERVAGELGFAVTGPGSVLHSSPFAGYSVSGLDGWLSGSAAGLVGLAITCIVCAGLSGAARRAAVVAPAR